MGLTSYSVDVKVEYFVVIKIYSIFKGFFDTKLVTCKIIKFKYDSFKSVIFKFDKFIKLFIILVGG